MRAVPVSRLEHQLGWILALVAWLAVARPGAAQGIEATLGTGLVSVRYGEAGGISLGTLTPTLSYSSPRLLLSAAGTYSAGADAVWSAQGNLSGSVYTSVLRSAWMGELGGVAAGSTHADGARTAQSLATLRLHRFGRAAGGWIGAGGGGIWDGIAWGAVRQGELGLFARGRVVTTTVLLTPTTALDSLRYVDTRALLGFARGPVEYRFSLGARLGDSLPIPVTDRRLWGDLGATVWLSARTAVLASAGLYPVDPTQGFPSGQFFALSVRIGGRRPAPSAAPAVADSAVRAAARRAGLERFDVTRSADGRARLRVRAPSATRVELAGDPTAWEPRAMTRGADGWWSLELTLPEGVHEVAIRLDGGPWLVPPGLPESRDEFGGVSGLLVVP